MKKIAVGVLVALFLTFGFLLLTSTKTQAQFGIPVILSAGVDTTNNKLKINGTNFGATPRVTLGTVPLTTQSSTATEVITDFSNSAFLPGTYVLKVQFSNGSLAVFVLSLGSITMTRTGCGTHAPVVVALATSISGVVGTAIGLAFQFFDEDISTCGANETFTLDSKFLSIPPLSSTVLSDRSSTAPFFIPDVPGTYIVRETVTDSTGRIGQVDITVGVTAF